MCSQKRLLYNFRERRFCFSPPVARRSFMAFRSFVRCKSVSLNIIPMARLPFRLVVRARFSIGPPWLEALRAVSRSRSSVRDVCPRNGSACVPPVLVWQYRGCERDSNLRERDRAMAVSQPRPPDRVDAALEKVAPLRYLEAHECVRSEQVVTRFYHYYSLSLDRFLSYEKIS